MVIRREAVLGGVVGLANKGKGKGREQEGGKKGLSSPDVVRCPQMICLKARWLLEIKYSRIASCMIKEGAL